MIDPPAPSGQIGLRALGAIIRHKSPLAALEVFHQTLGDVFRMTVPGFNPIVLVGPEANRFVLIEAREALRWRTESDPITRLLHHGLLVIDGAEHDLLRRVMTPAFHKRMLARYIETMGRITDQTAMTWGQSQPLDMLDQMRRIALPILIETMFGLDFRPEMARLFPAVVRSVRYISPGPWIVWPGIPRPGYARSLHQLDDYLRQLIRLRRQAGCPGDDLLGLLIAAPEVSDELIRDQMWTMLIAGHDTSTALLGWALYLLGRHPAVLAQAQAEVDAVLAGGCPTLENLGQLVYLEQVINETMRLYPPLHLGLRRPVAELEFQGYRLPAGSRVMYSPFLTHRQPDLWPEPHTFNPDRFTPDQNKNRPAYSFVPFGGGPRICLGAAFAQVEAKVILARLLQRFHLALTNPQVHMHLGVTIEPRPGVMMRVTRRHGK